jgi:hypothetical protein
MKGNLVKSTLAIVACAATPAVAYELDQPIQVNTTGLQSHVAMQVRKHADESAKALMEYLWFTRKIHHLWLDDVTKPRADTVATNDERMRPRIAIRTTGQQ